MQTHAQVRACKQFGVVLRLQPGSFDCYILQVQCSNLGEICFLLGAFPCDDDEEARELGCVIGVEEGGQAGGTIVEDESIEEDLEILIGGPGGGGNKEFGFARGEGCGVLGGFRKFGEESRSFRGGEGLKVGWRPVM